MLPIWLLKNIKFMKYAAAGIAIAGTAYYIYNAGYNAADSKWIVKSAIAVQEAVERTNKKYIMAKEKDAESIAKLRSSRERYKKLYQDAISFEPTNECQLTDGLYTSFNNGLTKPK